MKKIFPRSIVVLLLAFSVLNASVVSAKPNHDKIVWAWDGGSVPYSFLLPPNTGTTGYYQVVGAGERGLNLSTSTSDANVVGGLYLDWFGGTLTATFWLKEATDKFVDVRLWVGGQFETPPSTAAGLVSELANNYEFEVTRDVINPYGDGDVVVITVYNVPSPYRAVGYANIKEKD